MSMLFNTVSIAILAKHCYIRTVALIMYAIVNNSESGSQARYVQ